jgi:signal transduction histidine kinase
MAMHAVEHPRLLPAVLAPEPDVDPAGAPLPRSARDWLVDVAMFLLCAGSGALFWMIEVERRSDRELLILLDLVFGLALTVALWWRRRRPVGLALASVPVVAFSTFGGPAALALLFTVAVHRRWPAAVAIACLQLAATPLYLALYPEPDLPGWVMMVFVTLLTASVLAWGMFVRARRQLVLSLRERARRAESEQHLRVEQARQSERARIAREMHDVLAHRISLVSLHAGALEFRSDASRDEVARAAGVIRAAAHQALTDLREVIGILREPATPGSPEPPQPTLAQLPGLVDESRAAGMRVEPRIDVDDLEAVPASIGRSALRIVQEGLTNARKHAPGARVDVRVSGAAGEGLTVEVRNPLAVGVGSAAIPGAGTGLVGLAERATLAGGTLEHGVVDGEFRLVARLPWPAA